MAKSSQQKSSSLKTAEKRLSEQGLERLLPTFEGAAAWFKRCDEFAVGVEIAHVFERMGVRDGRALAGDTRKLGAAVRSMCVDKGGALTDDAVRVGTALLLMSVAVRDPKYLAICIARELAVEDLIDRLWSGKGNYAHIADPARKKKAPAKKKAVKKVEEPKAEETAPSTPGDDGAPQEVESTSET